MTSPNSVGAVSIEVLGDAKQLVRQVRKDFEKDFERLDLRRLIKEAAGNKPITVPVKAEVDGESVDEQVSKTKVPKLKVPLDPDTDSIPEKVRRTRVPKIQVPVDPLIQAFQEEVRRNIRSLSRETVKLPVTAETDELRRDVAAALARIKAESRIQVPVEADAKAAYEAKLRAQLAEVARRVKQHVEVKVDVDKSQLGSGAGGLGGAIGGIGKLLSGLTSAVPGLGRVTSGVADLTGSVQKLTGTSAQLGGSLAGAFQSAAGPIGAVIGAALAAAAAVAAIGTGAAAAVPVLGALAAALAATAGAAAALPAAAAGFGAAAATLGLGFSGITDAFKKQPKSGGGGGGGGAGEDPAARARRIAAAERGVVAARRGISAATRGVQAAERGLADAELRVSQAQVRAKAAQDAIGKARKEALEDIEDLNRSLKGAKLSEEDAALSVTEALRALNAAKETGVLPDISRADLEYRQAVQALEEARDTTQDLGDATAEANKKGVEGSDKVKDALQDQADAIQAVKDAQNGVVEAQNAILSANDSLAASYDGLKSAQDSLADAQKKAASAGGGGASGGVFDVVKLAPNAQKFVNAIKRLKPAFESLRLDVQNRLFKGLDETITKLAAGYEQPLKRTLGSYADTFNSFFRNLGTAVGKPKFIADLQVGAEGARQGLAKIGSSITTSLVPAFGSLSRAAGPFLSKLGEDLAAVITKFGTFITEAEKTGKLKTFFDKASEAMSDIVTTGTLVSQIIGNIFTIIFNGDGKKGSKSGIDSFNEGLAKLNRYLSDPKTQQKIEDFVASAKGIFADFQVAYEKAKPFLDKLVSPDGTSTLAEDAGKLIGAALIAGLKEGVKIALSNAVNNWKEYILNGPTSPIAWIRKALGIKSPSTVMATIGGQMIAGLIKGFRERVASFRDAAARLKTTILNTFSNAGKLLYNSGRNVIAGLINGAISLYGTLHARIAGAKSTITGALSNAGSLLLRIGRAVITGLKNGIRDALPGLGTFLGGVGQFIRDNKGPIEKDRVLLKPAGQAIMDGLIKGIGDKKTALAAQLSDVTTLVSGTSFDSLGSAGDAALTSSLSAHAEQRVLLDFAPGVSGDWLRDGLKRNIKFSHNGNVAKALGT